MVIIVIVIVSIDVHEVCVCLVPSKIGFFWLVDWLAYKKKYQNDTIGGGLSNPVLRTLSLSLSR